MGGDAAQVRTAYAEIMANAKAYLSALPLDGGEPAPDLIRGVGGGDRAAANSPPPRPSPIEGEGGHARILTLPLDGGGQGGGDPANSLTIVSWTPSGFARTSLFQNRRMR